MTAPDSERAHDGLQPGRLWSLWDMLDKHALYFVQATGALTEFKFLCASIEATNPAHALTPNLRKLAASAIHKLRQAYILSDMQEDIPPLERLERSVNTPEFTAATVGTEVKHLLPTIRDKLEQQYYFHMDQRDVRFYMDEHPFGGAVAAKFGNVTEDIGEAGKCLAFQRPTACVFHLMRVLELGVQALGKKLKVKINVRDETWHQIMLHVNKQIETMPSKTPAMKKKKSAYAGVAAHLQSVRLAWRNEVMHPKQTYTRDEALNLFNASKVFMGHLAEII